MKYSESPVEPLTQNPPNEVGWDYQNGDSRAAALSMEISRTPKRNPLLSKKRNSNSPLLYKPLKKKLLQADLHGQVVGLIEDLIAIETSTKTIKEKTVSQQKENAEDSCLIVEMNNESMDDSNIKLQVSDESPGCSVTHAKIDNDFAMNDSVNDDLMIQCTQAVEAEDIENKKMDSNLEKRFGSQIKDNAQSSNINTFVFSQNSSQSKESGLTTSRESSKKMALLDDSFDDFFEYMEIEKVVGEEDDKKSVQTHSVTSGKSMPTSSSMSSKSSAAVQRKWFPSTSSTFSSTSSSKPAPVASSNTYTDYSQVSVASSVKTKVVNTNGNFKYRDKNCALQNQFSSGFHTQSTSAHSSCDKNSDTRLFRAKSLSDTMFSNADTRLQRQNSKDFAKHNSESTCYGSGSSMGSKTLRRIQSNSSLGQWSVNNGSQRSSVNTLSSNGGSQSHSSREEIERKRQEALMRREARLGATRPIPKPMRR